MLVLLILTGGDVIAAFIAGLATETVQFINYFVYETIWTNYHDKRLRIKIEKTREVDIKLDFIKLDFDFLKEMSFEFSQTDTYDKEAYESVLSFFDKLLQNESLVEIQEDVQRDKIYFELKHQARSFKR